MEDNYPLISICIPTYNGATFLQEALLSVKQQTYKNLEVIISDDNSQDDTLEICAVFKKSTSIPVSIYNHTPSGIGANWNNSIEKSNGAFIKLLFQDDVLEPTCIEDMYNAIINNNLEIVFSKRSIIDENSKLVKTGNWFQKFSDLQKLVNLPDKELIILSKEDLKNLDFAVYSIDNIFGEPCVSLFSRSLYNKIGPFNTRLNQILDYEYWLRILKNNKIGILPQQLVKFRIHQKQASSINAKNLNTEYRNIKKLLYRDFLWDIAKKERRYYQLQKYPALKFVLGLKYKLFK